MCFSLREKEHKKKFYTVIKKSGGFLWEEKERRYSN
jgi:hypothetical protein